MVGRYAVLKSLEVVQLAINYTPLSMAYYVYDSTANLLFLGPTALACISKERHCNKELCGIGNFDFEPVIRKLQ